MEVAMPTTGNAIDSYEDMFKEITRKLYGEDGLPELIPSERLSTSQERSVNSVDYEIDNSVLKPEEHLTAFGLAALMQNGFPPAGILSPQFQQHKPNPSFEDKWIISEDSLQWTHSKIASYNPAQKLFRCAECDCVGYLPRVAEHWLGTHSNLRVFQCSQCPYESAWARCVRMHLTRQHNISAEDTTDVLLKNNPVLQEVTRYLQRLKSRLEITCVKQQAAEQQSSETFQHNNTPLNATARAIATQPITDGVETTGKRYSCSYCPYATDRRDLFTRHENIHREEKPFQCYVCQKQFNRADHVKKHFLRMHREHPYDLNRIRRHPPKNASGLSYYQKYNSSGPSIQTPESVPNEISGLGNCLTIPNNFSNNMNRSTTTTVPGIRSTSSSEPKLSNINKSTSVITKAASKKKGEKRFTCCYCSWSGVDNWCLKRHMNTHLKPFVCGLCDYKAARSERLATHVLKVHNKRACGKCTYLADDPAQLIVHQQEQHPLDQRNRSNTILRNNSFNATSNSPSTSFSLSQSNIKSYDLSAAAAIIHHGHRILQSDTKPWKPSHGPKQHGAARLFNYMEASDSSEPECESRGNEGDEMARATLNHRIQSDFPEAGDVGDCTEGNMEDLELPLSVCKMCGCEFEDDSSLETHQLAHSHHAASPARNEDTKENINPKGRANQYRCCLCKLSFSTQTGVMDHMSSHRSISYDDGRLEAQSKRSRKQRQPKKVVLPMFLEGAENLEDWHKNCTLYRKYMVQLVTRKGFACNWCRRDQLFQFRTRGGLALHQYWCHFRNRYECEHCQMLFRHRYQVVLHSSRVHVHKVRMKTQEDRLTHLVPTKESISHVASTTTTISNSADEHAYTFLGHISTAPVPVPEFSSSSITTVHKVGMSYLDRSFLHSNATINTHMPIVIPTFPPN